MRRLLTPAGVLLIACSLSLLSVDAFPHAGQQSAAARSAPVAQFDFDAHIGGGSPAAILVTQRTKRFLDLPLATLRQTEEGTVMIGDSKEDAGFDTGTTASITQTLAARAVAAFPHLADVSVVRTWGALRVMSPDGFPIYQTWPELPGVFALGCHSGVTLAAVHAEILAPAIAAGSLPDETVAFRAERFDVQDSTAA